MLNILKLVCLILCWNISIIGANVGRAFTNTEMVAADLIKNILPPSYNKNLRPGYGGPPLLVNLSIVINDISSISETGMEFKIDLYIRHFWNDQRITFDSSLLGSLTLGDEFAKKIWVPDTFFMNGKELNVHKSIFSEPTTLLRIKPTGDILYSTRAILVAQCPMDLTFFPMDQQKCSVPMASYGLNTEEVVYKWIENHAKAVEFDPIHLPTFNLIGFNKFESIDKFTTGNYTRVQCDFYLSRSFGFYVSQVYVPAFLVVVISWLPFWLDREDHHARVALGVTTVLTMTTLVTNTNQDFPKISHLKAIDIYLFVSFIMVFLSLIEYATVGYYEYILNRNKHQEHSITKLLPSDNNNNNNNDPESSQSFSMANLRKRAAVYPSTTTIETAIESPEHSPNIEKHLNVKRPDVRGQTVQQSSSQTQHQQQQSEQHHHHHHHKGPKIQDTSIIDKWARIAFPLVYVCFNILYALIMVFLISKYHESPEFPIKPM